MQAQMSARDVDRPEAELTVLFNGKYLSLTSFKRDGTGVARRCGSWLMPGGCWS